MCGIGFADCEQSEYRAAKINPLDLRHGLFRPGAVARLIPQSNTNARLGTTRTGQALVGGSAEMGTSRNRSMPTEGSYSSCRANPESTTAVMPSTVTEVSATLVASTTLRRSSFWSGLVLLFGRQIAVKR